MTSDDGRWRALGLIATAELLGMSPWFGASAAAQHMQALWALDVSRSAALTSAVQIGFVGGTALLALLNLVDLIATRWLFASSALLAALANLALLATSGFEGALALRFLTGFFLAGVYPPAMKMAATWFRDARGLAIGAVVGALTIGKGTPYLIRSLGGGDLQTVVLATSMGAFAAALLIGAGYRDGPHTFERRPFSWALVGVVLRHRPTRLATVGYLGHMWELYAMWTWLPAYLAASAAASGVPFATDLVAFLALAAGALGCVAGGWLADRWGRERLVEMALLGSGLCCLLTAVLFGGPLWPLVIVSLAWGVLVIADSAQFSALVTEIAPSHAVGTALALQTSLGFMLTIVTIQLVPMLADALSWRWAFPILVAGPAVGIAATERLKRLRRS